MRVGILACLLIALLGISLWSLTLTPAHVNPTQQVDIPEGFRRRVAGQWKPAFTRPEEQRLVDAENVAITYLLYRGFLTEAQQEAIIHVAMKGLLQGLSDLGIDFRGHPGYGHKYLLRLLHEDLGRDTSQVTSDIPALAVSGLETIQTSIMPPLCQDEVPYDQMEEHNFHLLFRDPAFVDPAWSARILQAARINDMSRIADLSTQRPNEGATDRPSAEIFLQIAAYASERAGSHQIENLRKLLPDYDFRERDWAEIGYGSGKIFRLVRNLIGPTSRLIGVEVGSGQEMYAQRLQSTRLTGWGRVEFIRGTYSDCGLQRNSVDIIHAASVHVGSYSTKQQLREETIPWLMSAKRALKPGGLIILDDNGQPPLSELRATMALAGLEEHRVTYLEPSADGRRGFIAAFRLRAP